MLVCKLPSNQYLIPHSRTMSSINFYPHKSNSTLVFICLTSKNAFNCQFLRMEHERSGPMLGAKTLVCKYRNMYHIVIFMQRQELKSNFKYRALRRFYCLFIMYRTTSGLMPVNVSRDWCQQWPVLMGRPCQIMRPGSLGLLHLH